MANDSTLLIPKDQLKNVKPWNPGALAARGPGAERRAANQMPPGGPERRSPTDPDEEARQAAAAAKAAEQSRLNQLMRTATQRGFEAGYGEGKALVEAHLARLASIAAQMQSATAQLEETMSVQLLDLALDIARHVIRSELAADRGALLVLVRETLRLAPEGTGQGELLLHPDDVALVRDALDEELQLGGWRVVADRAIESGGCRLVARNGDVDATLAARWRRVMQSLARADEWKPAAALPVPPAPAASKT